MCHAQTQNKSESGDEAQGDVQQLCKLKAIGSRPIFSTTLIGARNGIGSVLHAEICEFEPHPINMNFTEEEFMKECYRFLDYFGVDYKGKILYMDSGGNSIVCKANGHFDKVFVGKSINSVTRYVAEKLGKEIEYID